MSKAIFKFMFVAASLMLGSQSWANTAQETNTSPSNPGATVPNAAGKNPFTMVSDVTNRTFDRFHKEQGKINANPNYLKTIVIEEVMPYIDYRYAAYTVLGPFLKESTKEQRDQFVTVFRDYLITTYAQVFASYTDQTIQFSPAGNFSDDNRVAVPVQINNGDAPPVNIEFRTRRLKDNSWKTYDLIAAGVSLLSSKRAEIQSVINSQGINAIITQLKSKASEPVVRNGVTGT